MATNRSSPVPSRTTNHVRRRARRSAVMELLEPRYAMATLGLGVRVLNDVAGVPGTERLSPLQVNETFWVEVLAEDQRNPAATAQGVTGLALNLSWDPSKLTLLNPPVDFFPNSIPLGDVLITPDFTQIRGADAFNPSVGHVPLAAAVPNPANIQGLQGGSVPNVFGDKAIGAPVENTLQTFGHFSRLQFQALAVADDTPFTMELAAGVDFFDADPLDQTNPTNVLSGARRQTRQDVGDARPVTAPGERLPFAVTEFLEIRQPTATNSLSGYAFADANLNGQMDIAADGTPLEFGLPNVQIQLFQPNAVGPVATTTTGPDGSYFFHGLGRGVYSIVETQPAGYIDAGTELGTILAGANSPAADAATRDGRRGVAATNAFSNIELRVDEQGIRYNFGENVIPTKNAFRARSIPRVSLNEQLGLRTAVVTPTTAADNITVQITTNQVIVAMNAAAARVIDRAKYDIVLVDGLTNQDTVQVTGTDENETANFQPRSVSHRTGNDFQGLNVGLLTTGDAAVDITAGVGGVDRAVINDTLGVDDDLVEAIATATLTNVAGRFAQAVDFTFVRAVKQQPVAPPEDDTSDATLPLAYVLALVGDWRDI